MRLRRWAASSGWKSCRLRAADKRERRARGRDERHRVDAGELLPEVRIEGERPTFSALGVGDLDGRAPGDVVENEQVLAGLRRREAEAGHDRLERRLESGAPSSAAAANGGARSAARRRADRPSPRPGARRAQGPSRPVRRRSGRRQPAVPPRMRLRRGRPPSPRARIDRTCRPAASRSGPCRSRSARRPASRRRRMAR